MRLATSHFDLVLDRLAWLKPFMHKVKINTFVSIKNAASINEMVPLIARLGPSCWSLYQYWPLSLGASAAADHLISTEQFSSVVGSLPASIDCVRVEVNPIPVRRLTYPFVSHEGNLYLHHPTDGSSYQSLGSIFSADSVARMFALCREERGNALPRYRAQV